MELKKEYKTIDEVVLKPNQVILKPERPLEAAATISPKLKFLFTNLIILIFLVLSVIFLFIDNTGLRIIGGILLGIVISYVLKLIYK